MDDDIFILNSNINIIKTTKQMLTNRFNINNIGVAYFILGLRIYKIHDGLILSQFYCIEKILDKFDKNENNITKTLIYVNLCL